MSIRVLITAAAVLAALPFGACSSVSAQTEIEIARPLDGATVRETVSIIVPASSVPESGFISVMLGGRFRCATAGKSDAANAFVYRWDTKASMTDAAGNEIQPREGKHLIRVQGYDASTKKYGDPKEITVYVKNNASELMPPVGLRLQYNDKVGIVSRYHVRSTVNLKDVSGDTDLAATLGQDIEGVDLVIKRSVEDHRSGGTSLIRQKLEGDLKVIQAGREIPFTALIPKAAYRVEDRSGHTTAVISSLGQGLPISVDLPNLPPHRVRIGDTWTQQEKLLQDVLTGEAATLDCTRTLEGLEWEGGHPCAKIRTTFSGTTKLPSSTLLPQSVPIKGEAVTYFAFQVGKVVSSVTTAIVTTALDSSAISSLKEQLLKTATPEYISGLSAPGSAGYSGPDVPGPGVPPPPYADEPVIAPRARPGVFQRTRESAGISEKMSVTFELKQVIELVH